CGVTTVAVLLYSAIWSATAKVLQLVQDASAMALLPGLTVWPGMRSSRTPPRTASLESVRFMASTMFRGPPDGDTPAAALGLVVTVSVADGLAAALGLVCAASAAGGLGEAVALGSDDGEAEGLVTIWASATPEEGRVAQAGMPPKRQPPRAKPRTTMFAETMSARRRGLLLMHLHLNEHSKGQ